MSTRTHRHSIEIRATTHQVFQALITPSAIRQWWQASSALVLAEPNGYWMVAWGASEDDPDYLTACRISIYEPPTRLGFTAYSYRAKSGPLPFRADFETTFAVTSLPHGSRLEVAQSGFPTATIADDFFKACAQGWHTTLENLKKYLEPLED